MTETPKPLPVRGRPTTLLTADMIKLIAGAVEQGKTRSEAAAAAGVSSSVVARWITIGRRLRDVGSAEGTLPSQEWLCLRLVKSVTEAEERRERVVAEEAAAAVGPPKAKGRPPLLLPWHVDTVVDALAAGETRAAAAAAAGVTGRTLQRWLARGARAHFGAPRTEYETRCAALYRRVRDVEKESVAEHQDVPEIETKSLEGLDLTLSREEIEAIEQKWAASFPRHGGVIVPDASRWTARTIDLAKLPAGAQVQGFDPDRIAENSITIGKISRDSIAVTMPQKPLDWAELVVAMDKLSVLSTPSGTVVDIRPARGRVRTWLRNALTRAAQAL
jgi:hypothetical protein